ncbi:CRISPR-associated endonuclease Cas2 [Natranaerobius trueperi]|uniref:CRISPR-associated endoribonuclease Cas2 n=1 Tax=Natranaerobius trueperi TaxID=759412 RepID=A0A226BZH6_9FIRM|nr:CRISPR-associated endonuclease Cas2 [Natranaerobius trueperi]OWZ83734.1 CRISPR-associated endonuclease Cas2 [Natranaerobius trueperi]
MYIIGIYDVNKKRVGKIKKLFDRYMFWTQNSVFEGKLTKVQLRELRNKLDGIIDPEEDQVIFYQLGNQKWLNKTILGKQVDDDPPNFI